MVAVVQSIHRSGVEPVGSLVVDIDNTLVDSLSMLASRLPGYDPASQLGYRLTPEQLEPFSDPGFYAQPVFNWEVVYIIVSHLSRGYRVVFVSQSPSTAVHEAKGRMLTDLFESLGFGGITIPVTSEATLEGGWQGLLAETFAGGNPNHELVFVDDAPHRLEAVDAVIRRSLVVSNLGDVSSLAPAYPYNELWHTPDSPEPACLNPSANLKYQNRLFGHDGCEVGFPAFPLTAETVVLGV